MPTALHSPTPAPTLNLLGAGKVAQTLASLWHRSGTFTVQDVLTTSLHSAHGACSVIGAGSPVAQLRAMRRANVWMLAVPDAQLADCALALAAILDRNTLARGASIPVIFHCSGAQSSVILEPLAALGCHVASAHCILSFASVPNAIVQFPGTPCALEGDAAACTTLREVFSSIGARCFDVASSHKLLYHAAAVFATNFLPVLQATAEELWRATGVPADAIVDLRAALLRNAVSNITALGPQAALTGPAARGDTAAITHQGEAVTAWDATTGAAYEALSMLALRLAQRQTDAR